MSACRSGHWCWSLSAEEGATALLMRRARRKRLPVTPELKRRYAAMLDKQRKALRQTRLRFQAVMPGQPGTGIRLDAGT